jgi:DinB superfamily
MRIKRQLPYRFNSLLHQSRARSQLHRRLTFDDCESSLRLFLFVRSPSVRQGLLHFNLSRATATIHPENVMTSEERQQLIIQYKDGYSEVAAALDGFAADALAAHPIAGKWSAAEIVHHLADSETTSGLRLRRLLTEDHPLIQGYDQDAYANSLYYNQREIAPSLEAFRSARATTAQLFDFMTAEDWLREGTHSESGSYSAADWLKIYAAHAHNHAGQIRRLRDALAQSAAAGG